MSVADSNESVNGWGDVIGFCLWGFGMCGRLGGRDVEDRCLRVGFIVEYRKGRKTAGFIGLVVRIAG